MAGVITQMSTKTSIRAIHKTEENVSPRGFGASLFFQSRAELVTFSARASTHDYKHQNEQWSWVKVIRGGSVHFF